MPRYFDSQQTMDAFLVQEQSQQCQDNALIAKVNNDYMFRGYDLKVKGYRLVTKKKNLCLQSVFDGFWSHDTVFIHPLGKFACGISPNDRIQFTHAPIAGSYAVRLWQHSRNYLEFYMQVGGFPDWGYVWRHNPGVLKVEPSKHASQIVAKSYHLNWRLLSFPLVAIGDIVFT